MTDVATTRANDRSKPLRLMLPQATDGWDAVTRDALIFLLRGWRTHFHDAAHIMSFPPEQGFRDPDAVHSGDVFTRALLADALIDADQAFGQLDDIIAAELDYLLSTRRTDGIGGWSYFPRLIELPPDADDLAQVMIAMLRRGRFEAVRSTCELVLEVLFNDNAHADGSFETWIVPATARSEHQRLQAQWIRKAWGNGPDPEVIANLLHALTLYDANRFRARIAQGMQYLQSRQQADGSWLSTWYWGPFYSTYVAVRLLKPAPDASPCIDAATEFLLSAQRTDGGWGWGEQSDALSTALAMLALVTTGHRHGPAMDGALEYFSAHTATNGGWPAAPFIRMELGRPSGRVHQVLSYGADLVTTGFVLKSALAARACLD